LSPPASVTVLVRSVMANPVLISAGDSWRYLDNGVAQPVNWNTNTFSDVSWSTGNGKLGFKDPGNSGFTTILSFGTNANNKYPAYHFRKQVNLSSLVGMTNLLLEVMRDDGVVVYINGTAVWRDNLPSGTIAYTQLATNCSDQGTVWQTVTLSTNNLRLGTNLIAAEVHQSSLSSSDIAFDLRLTLLGSVLGPAFITHPQSQTANEGTNVAFTLSAVGDAPLTYQWRKNNTPLVGRTAATLALPSVTLADAGQYDAVASNFAGAVASFAANLTVNPRTPILLSATPQGGSLVLQWSGGFSPYQVQQATNFAGGAWGNLGDPTTNRSFSIALTNERSFYRVLGQ
jgi:hypothetical protein